MPLDFNILKQSGPANFYEGLMQGQEKQRVNALAEQEAAQKQELNALRMQQTRGAISQPEREVKQQEVARKTNMFRERLLRAPNPQAVRELVKMQYADPDLGPILSQAGTLEQALAEVSDDPTQFERYRQQEAMGMAEWLKSQQPKAVGTRIFNPQTNAFIEPAATPAVLPTSAVEYGLSKQDPGFMKFLQERAIAMRPPAQPRAEQPPVAVVDPATGKQVFVTREEALRGRMTPAAAMESLPAKEIQKREAALPQATSAVQGFESKADKFVADLKALRDDPGLENITGPIFGRTGSVSREGSRAQALYDKVVAKGGFQALQDLRDASKTGGALGNVSNQEGKQLTASFAAIDRRQNAADVRAAIDQSIADIEGSKTRMREAYDSTYSYKESGAAKPSKPSPTLNIDALLNKYK